MITNTSFWFWFGGLWLAVGLAFVAVGGGLGLHRSNLDTQLDARGVHVEGIVLTKETAAPRDSTETYRVTFRFTSALGETVRGSADVTPETWDALVERGPIEVVYLSGEPETYRVAGQSDDDAVLALVFPLVGGVLAVVGGFVVGNALRMRRLARDLGQRGALAVASVTEVGPGRVRINGVLQWVLRYRFNDQRGRAHEGKCSLAPDAAAGWQPGTRGRVRYDPRNPRAHVWTGERA